jgi:hypothetical protein
VDRFLQREDEFAILLARPQEGAQEIVVEEHCLQSGDRLLRAAHALRPGVEGDVLVEQLRRHAFEAGLLDERQPLRQRQGASMARIAHLLIGVEGAGGVDHLGRRRQRQHRRVGADVVDERKDAARLEDAEALGDERAGIRKVMRC